MYNQENGKSVKLLCFGQLFSIIITIGNIVYSFIIKRTPFDYTSFFITTNKSYIILKYSSSLFHIYMACLIAQIITLITSILALLIIISLTKIYSFSCVHPKDIKTSIILYLSIAISILGQTIVCSHFIQMRVQLTPQSTTNGRQQLIIGILSGINLILLVTVLIATFCLSFYNFENNQSNTQPNTIDGMLIPKNLSTLPLRTILNNRLTLRQMNNSQDRHRRTDKNQSSRRYIKSTIPPRNYTVTQQHNLYQQGLLPNPTAPKQSKQPLLQKQDQLSNQSGQSDNEKYLINKVDMRKQQKNIKQVNIKSAVNLSNLSISIIKPKAREKIDNNQDSHLSDQNDIPKSKSNVIILNPVENDKVSKIEKKNLRLNLKDIKLKLKKKSEQTPFHVRQRKKEAKFQVNQVDSDFFNDQ